ncbi:MAG: cryptochrome/photolyase family protein [Geitlerinemataceae cyanobacterium]
MTTGLWILGNQLAIAGGHLRDRPKDTPLALIESRNFSTARPYHRQKLVLVWSAMRHFAEDLRAAGYTDVTYAIADDFATPLRDWIADRGLDTVAVMEPTDFPFRRAIEAMPLPSTNSPDGVAIDWLDNDLFFQSEAKFVKWAKGRKRLRMEDFYRQSRKDFDILMTEDGEPAGDRWNFDKENRKPPKKGLNPPPSLLFEPDEITCEVMAKVEEIGGELYGQMEPFGWAVTRSQALEVLDNFLEKRLAGFGTYQDAMVTGETTMWHALLSPYLNLGLLSPHEVVEAIETEYEKSVGSDNEMSLASVEGVIRQILGWREYMRGLYVFFGEDYAESNALDHHQPLPEFFWDASKTKMNCLKQSLKQVEETGYGHHIQRLMVLANFATIAGIEPQAIEQWFHAAFIDAYDWVMQTNVLGMGIFADGGKLATKPYVASANYIHKMSDYCKGCAYDRKDRLGEKACPFNYLYWNFLDRHHDTLKSQGRMNLILAQLRKIPEGDRQQIRDRAQEFLAALSYGKESQN